MVVCFERIQLQSANWCRPGRLNGNKRRLTVPITIIASLPATQGWGARIKNPTPPHFETQDGGGGGGVLSTPVRPNKQPVLTCA